MKRVVLREVRGEIEGGKNTGIHTEWRELDSYRIDLENKR